MFGHPRPADSLFRLTIAHREDRFSSPMAPDRKRRAGGERSGSCCRCDSRGFGGMAEDFGHDLAEKLHGVGLVVASRSFARLGLLLPGNAINDEQQDGSRGGDEDPTEVE